MKPVAWLIAVAAAVVLTSGVCRAQAVSSEVATAVQAGAQIDAECIKKNVLKEIGACRVAATAEKRDAPVMLGLYFHMWFSDAVLAEAYGRTKAELSQVFEKLADAEFPAVVEYETALRVQPADLCQIIKVNCATMARYHQQWLARVPK